MRSKRGRAQTSKCAGNQVPTWLPELATVLGHSGIAALAQESTGILQRQS